MPVSTVNTGSTSDPHILSLRELMDERDRRYQSMFDGEKDARATALAAQEKLVQAAFESSEKAIDKAERAQELRNSVSNEFRAQLTDQAARFVSRVEVDAALVAIRNEFTPQMANLKEQIDKQSGRGVGTSATIGIFMAIGGLAIAGLSILIRFIE